MPRSESDNSETEYDFAGNVSEDEAQELIDFCSELKKILSLFQSKLTIQLLQNLFWTPGLA